MTEGIEMLRKLIDKLFPDQPLRGYHVTIYLDEKLTIPMWSLNSRDWNEVKEFMKDHLEAGLNCKFYDYESKYHEGGIALAKNFNESTVDVEELIEYLSYM
jgi:hypothetical protein